MYCEKIPPALIKKPSIAGYFNKTVIFEGEGEGEGGFPHVIIGSEYPRKF